MNHSPTDTERWYDLDPAMHQVMDSMKELPIEYVLGIAELINEHIQDKKLMASSDELKSYGFEKIVMLMRSKIMRRWYDQFPEMHKAVNNLMMIDPVERSHLVYRAKVALDVIDNYMNACQSFNRLPDPKEIEQLLVNVFVREIDQVTAMPEPPEIVTRVEESKVVGATVDLSMVMDEDSGMRVTNQ